MLNESLTLDPLYAPTLTVLCWLQDRRQHWAEAEADAQRAIDISPTYTSARLSLGQVLLEEGKTDSALAELSKSDSPLRGTAMVYWTLGRRAESNRTLSELKTKCAGKCAYAIAAVYAWRGQSDQALLWLDEAYSRKDPLLYQVNGDPVFSKISEEPRFKAFLRKINAPE
jgi:tetratricopeptide (TPR) repeat protein